MDLGRKLGEQLFEQLKAKNVTIPSSTSIHFSALIKKDGKIEFMNYLFVGTVEESIQQLLIPEIHEAAKHIQFPVPSREFTISQQVIL